MYIEEKYQDYLKNNPYSRTLIPYENELSPVFLKQDNQIFLNFSSNDYLGLSKHPLLIKKVKQFTDTYGISVGSSRLVTGHRNFIQEVEEKLAQALGKPEALILGAGYQTNISVLEALLDKQKLKGMPIVYCDKLIHTSMLACTRHIAELKRFKHNDLNDLKKYLEKTVSLNRPKFILVESLYSMDGDQTNLKELIYLAKEYDAFLYVDDAHAVGLYGEKGWGFASDYPNIDLIMGTFSKALGSFGGYVGCSTITKNYLINHCKGFIYSTGLPAPIWGAIAASIELIPLLKEERERVIKHTKKLLAFFAKNNLNCGRATSHIIPWIIGDNEKTLRASYLLKEKKILGITIRPPSVPKGQSRIRFCLSASHTDEHVEQLMDAIKDVAGQL